MFSAELARRAVAIVNPINATEAAILSLEAILVAFSTGSASPPNSNQPPNLIAIENIAIEKAQGLNADY